MAAENIEFKFVVDTLKKFGYDLKNIMVSKINEKDLVSKKGDGAHLKDSIRFEVKSAGRNGGELMFYFPDHGRLVEIQYFKKTTNGAAFGQKTNHGLWTAKPNRGLMNRKKDTRWYSKSAYGSINTLIGTLMYGLTDEVEKQLISELLTK